MPSFPAQDLSLLPSEDYSTAQQGAAFYPLRPDPGGPLPSWGPGAALLRDADPARFYAVDFVAWSLNYFLSQRLAAEGAKCGVAIGQAVNAVSLVDPDPFLAGSYLTAYRFPLLAVYRQRSIAKYVSTTYAYRDATWQCRYVLPAMGLAAAEKLSPILRAVEGVFDFVVEQGWHPQYQPPGGSLGDQAWKENLAGLQEVNTSDATWSWLPESEGGNVYLSLAINLLVKERRMPVLAPLPGAPSPFLGIDLDEQVATPDSSPPLDGVVRARSDVDPPKPGA